MYYFCLFICSCVFHKFRKKKIEDVTSMLFLSFMILSLHFVIDHHLWEFPSRSDSARRTEPRMGIVLIPEVAHRKARGARRHDVLLSERSGWTMDATLKAGCPCEAEHRHAKNHDSKKPKWIELSTKWIELSHSP